MADNKHRGPFSIAGGGLKVSGFEMVEETLSVDLSTLTFAEGSDDDAGKWIADVDATDLGTTIEYGLHYGYSLADLAGADSTSCAIRVQSQTTGTIDLETPGDEATVWFGMAVPASGTILQLVLDGGSDDDPTGGTFVCRIFGFRTA